jgi:hypothetical protein
MANPATERGVEFNLTLDENPEDGDEPDWDYEPKANAHLLPDFMQEDISFPVSSAPQFLSKAVEALFRVD